jgi:hypothetical protein
VLPLDEVLENEATGAFARMERNLDCQGGTITMDGKAHARGLAVGTRGEAGSISYELGGRWRRLKATIGLNPEKPLAELDPQQLAAGISFVVFGDGRELYRSPTVRCDSPALDVDVELAGVQVLRLEVDRGPGRLAVRSVNWADIRLEAR